MNKSLVNDAIDIIPEELTFIALVYDNSNYLIFAQSEKAIFKFIWDGVSAGWWHREVYTII